MTRRADEPLRQGNESEHDKFQIQPETEVTETGNTVPPPDGGWGWVVCFACFLTHVLTDGTFYSFGIIFIELLDFYQEDKGSTAVIASLSFGVCLLSGPLNAAMTNYFGFRKTTIFGTILMTSSLICSIFSPSVFYLYITFGISGWGFGMVYLSSIVCVTMYFEKRRAFAVGLGVSGSGIGTFIFGFLTRALIDNYSWKGAILIQSGLMLNCIACGLVYLPLSHDINTTDKLNVTFQLVSSSGSDPEPTTKHKNMASNNFNEESNANSCETEPNFNPSRDHVTPSAIKNSPPYTDDVIFAATKEKYTNSHDKGERAEKSEPTDQDRLTPDEHVSVLNGDENKGFIAEIKNALKQSFNFNVFKNIAYLLYILSTIFYSIGYYIPYIYLPDKAELSGIDSFQSAGLISSIGITNTIGRIIFGFISDLKCINRLLLYNVALIICGAGTIVCPFLDTFGALLTYTVIFGLFSGVTISLTSVIVADLVGTEMLADAFGVMNFFAGIFTFLGPPIAGWLFDITKSYDLPFLAAGIAITLSGAMLFVLPLIRRKQTPNTNID